MRVGSWGKGVVHLGSGAGFQGGTIQPEYGVDTFRGNREIPPTDT